MRRQIEDELRRKLTALRRYVTNDTEGRLLAGAESEIDAYLTASRQPPQLPDLADSAQGAAYRALDRLVKFNVQQSNDAQVDASRWNDVANVLGIGLGALVLTVVAALVVWLRRHAFAPMFGLASAMDRFGRGDPEARADERGPRELREICAGFNEMASAIATQRRAQMAFLGGVAHDLRNPLSVLRLGVALIAPGKPPQSEEKVRQTIERLARQFTRMDRMLGDLLDVAKVEAGELELRIGTHDARKLVWRDRRPLRQLG